MSDDMALWMISLTMYLGGLWHGWILGGARELVKQTRRMREGRKDA